MVQQCFSRSAHSRSASPNWTTAAPRRTPPTTPPDESPGGGAACSIAVTDSFTSVTGEAEIEEGRSSVRAEGQRRHLRNERDLSVTTGLNVSVTLCMVRRGSSAVSPGGPSSWTRTATPSGSTSWTGSTPPRPRWNCGRVSPASTAGRRAVRVRGVPLHRGLAPRRVPGVGRLRHPVLHHPDRVREGNHAWGRGPTPTSQGSVDGRLVDPMTSGSLLRLMSTDVPPPAYISTCVDCLPPTAEFGYGGSRSTPRRPCLVLA